MRMRGCALIVSAEGMWYVGMGELFLWCRIGAVCVEVLVGSVEGIGVLLLMMVVEVLLVRYKVLLGNVLNFFLIILICIVFKREVRWECGEAGNDRSAGGGVYWDDGVGGKERGRRSW